MAVKLTTGQKLAIKVELARRNFFYYCNLRIPKLYKLKGEKGYAPYLEELCTKLQEFYEQKDNRIFIINLPPRHTKSLTAQLFEQWMYGKDPTTRIMSGSYNSDLSSMFAKNVRNAIAEDKLDTSVVYSDVFPHTKIKKGDGASDLWALDGSPVPNFLATSPKAQATGIGCNFLVIDDIIKTYEEACNEDALNKHYDWFCNTMLSRLEDGGKIILIMTRWSDLDLCGRVMNDFAEWGVVKFVRKALQDDGTMLNPELLSKKDYELKVKVMGEEVVSANYDQVPINIKGCLYKDLQTYDDLPRDSHGNLLLEEIRAVCDTADTGNDWLCGIVYGVFNYQAYILDVLYTREAMETTEPAFAKMLHENDCTIADIESNNGGRGFARNVEMLLHNKLNNYRCSINWYHQSKNKQARILSNSSVVIKNVIFPNDWKEKFPEFHRDVTRYQRIGKNKNDDCADCLTQLVERMACTQLFDFS